MSQRRNVTPWFPVAIDPVHEGIYEVEYRQSRFLFRREWRDGVWCTPGAVLLPATRPKRWRGLTAPDVVRGLVTCGGGLPGDPNGEQAALAVEVLVRKYEGAMPRERLREALLEAYLMGAQNILGQL